MNVIDLFPTPVCEKYLDPLSKNVLDKIYKYKMKPDWQYKVLKSENTYCDRDWETNQLHSF